MAEPSRLSVEHLSDLDAMLHSKPRCEQKLLADFPRIAERMVKVQIESEFVNDHLDQNTPWASRTEEYIPNQHRGRVVDYSDIIPFLRCRGRDDPHGSPPAQIRTSASTHTALLKDEWRGANPDCGLPHAHRPNAGSCFFPLRVRSMYA